MIEKLGEGGNYLVMKVIIPAIIIISIRLAYISRKVTLSFWLVLTSYVIGVGMVIICSDLILANVSKDHVTIVSAIVAISSEKIAHYMIYRFRIDTFLSAFFDTLISKMKK